MLEGIPGLDSILPALDMSNWGFMIAGQIGYFVGFVINWAVIITLLYFLVLKKYVLYRYDVEVTCRRGNNAEVIMHDRGRDFKLKDGTKGFKLLKGKTIMDPLDYNLVIPNGKRMTLGLVRVYKNSPKSYSYLQNNLIENDEPFQRLKIVEKDMNRALEMEVNSNRKLEQGSILREFVMPIIQIGAIVTIVILIFMMSDKFTQAASILSSGMDSIKVAISTLNKCQVTQAVGSVMP